MIIRYFKEYYLLKPKYQDTTQIIAGVGLVGGIVLFWNVIGPILGQAARPAGGDPFQEYASWKLVLVFLGLPLSIWLVLIATALLQVLLSKLTLAEALDFGCRFRYPGHWLKEKSDVTIREEKIRELDERLKGP